MSFWASKCVGGLLVSILIFNGYESRSISIYIPKRKKTHEKQQVLNMKHCCQMKEERERKNCNAKKTNPK